VLCKLPQHCLHHPGRGGGERAGAATQLRVPHIAGHMHREYWNGVDARVPGEDDEEVGIDRPVNPVRMDEPSLSFMELIRPPGRSGESLRWSVEQRLDVPPDVDARRVKRGVNEGDLHHTVFGADENKRAGCGYTWLWTTMHRPDGDLNLNNDTFIFYAG